LADARAPLLRANTHALLDGRGAVPMHLQRLLFDDVVVNDALQTLQKRLLILYTPASPHEYGVYVVPEKAAAAVADGNQSERWLCMTRVQAQPVSVRAWV
jgi:hypothetical protein